MRIAAVELEDNIVAAFMQLGASAEQAQATARHMVWCERVGRHNFGIERVAIHAKRIGAGALNPAAIVALEQRGPSVAVVDGGNGFGYHAAECAMNHAISLARAGGTGVVGVRNSNFFGAGAYYVNMAADADMIGMAMSNSFPKVVAHGGLKPVLGTNPFAFGAPARDGRHLLFDMATSALAGSTVRQHIASNTPLPEGLAIDEAGRPITDPEKAASGALLPFGGAKGYGLSLMVELLAGVLTGAGMSSGVASMYKEFSRGGDNGHFVMALDIGRFMALSDYFDRFDGLLGLLRQSGSHVLYPGEARWNEAATSESSGIEVDDTQWDALRALQAR